MTVAFDAALQDLSPPEVAAFVADLRAAGGWETAVEGATVTATRAGETRRLRVLGDAPSDATVDAGTVDAVISTAPGSPQGGVVADAPVLSPADLYDRVAYGVSPDERAALLARHLGDPDASPPASWSATSDGGDDPFDGLAPAVDPEGDRPDPGAVTEDGPEAAVGAAATRPGDARPAGAADPDLDSETDESPADATPSRGVWVALTLAVVLGTALGAAALWPTADGGAAADVPTAAGDEATAGPEAADTVTQRHREQAAWTTESTGPTGQRRYATLEPNCRRPPGLVVRIQVGALRHNDPETNDGIRTLWLFASEVNRRNTGAYPAFVDEYRSPEYRPLFEYERATFGPLERDEETARQRVTVSGPNGTATYNWGLVRQANGRHEGCWLTDGVARVDGGDKWERDGTTARMITRELNQDFQPSGIW